jgi:tetratricopeptide (TPR) repeat protein
MGRAAAARGDDDLAGRAFTDSVDLHERLGDLFGWGWSKVWLGGLARRVRDLDSDERIQLEVLERCETIPHVAAAAWSELAVISYVRGEAEVAIRHVERALDIYRELGDRWQIAIHLSRRSAMSGEDLDAGAAYAIAALKLHRELAADPDLPRTLRNAAFLLLKARRPIEAATIVGAMPEEVVLTEYPIGPRLRSSAPLRELLSDASLAVQLRRGARIGLRDVSDAAIEWLERAYPASASISV